MGSEEIASSANEVSDSIQEKRMAVAWDEAFAFLLYL
jgi:hypothetical protein